MIFADTVYFLALLNPEDQWHGAVRNLTQTLRNERVLTTAWVLLETANGLAQTPNRRTFKAFVGEMEKRRNLEIVSPTMDWFHRGLELYEARPDKEWSLTDCISFEVMRERQIRGALTADHHFRQAGFELLVHL